MPVGESKLRSTCSNFALNVKTVNSLTREHDLELIKNIHCEHSMTIPETLNSDRYLGSPEKQRNMDREHVQQDFNYVENFRVDYAETSPITKFSLDEKTVVRIEGLEHNDLDF